MKNKLTSKDVELDKQIEKRMFFLRRKRNKIFKDTEDLSLIQITPEEEQFIQQKADLYEKLTGVDRREDMLEFYKKCIRSAKLRQNYMTYSYFLIKINQMLNTDYNFKKKGIKMQNINIDNNELIRKFRLEREKRYKLYKATQDNQLLELTEVEYLYLIELAKKIEGITKRDSFCDLVDHYQRCVKEYANEQPYVVSQRFRVLVNNVIDKDIHKNVRTVEFSNMHALEQILGEEAVYSGDHILVTNLQQQEVIPSIVNVIGKQRFDFLNDIVNNDRSITSISAEQGVSKQRISEKVEQIRKAIKKHELGQNLQEVYNDSLIVEDSTLNTTWIKEK